MAGEEFRKQLVELVKASGQEVIDRAEDLVGEGDLIFDFGFRFRQTLSQPSKYRSLIVQRTQ